MTDPQLQRRLAAILSADVAGYSRLTSLDETATHHRLNACRGIADAVIEHDRGRIVGTAGDSILAEFHSVHDCVQCAVDIQKAIAEENKKRPVGPLLQFRIGVNLSEVIVEPTSIFGEGVNIAVRIQGLAPPGGISVSAAVRDQLGAGSSSWHFDDMGEQQLKNIPRSVRVYRLRGWGDGEMDGAPLLQAPYPSPERPSIAVLPFASLGSDSAESYFSDGMVEDITTALCRFRWLNVIARNSASAYKGRAADVRQIARELGVRYLVEGSVRRAPGQMRIAAQLIDAASATYLWGEHFDGESSDVFALQDRIAERIVTSIEPRLRTAEIQRARRKPAGNLDAYDYYLRALPHRQAATVEDNAEALRLLRKSLELDPRYAPALATAAMCLSMRRDQGWGALAAAEIEETLRLARAAVKADPDDPVALCLSGHVLATIGGDYEGGLAWIDSALLLNPSFAEGWARSSMVRVYQADYATAIDHAETALKLNALDPHFFLPFFCLGFANLFLERYDEAAIFARRVLKGQILLSTPYRILIVALHRLGRGEEARKTAAEFLGRYPNFRISDWRANTPFTSERQLNLMIESFEAVGLPR